LPDIASVSVEFPANPGYSFKVIQEETPSFRLLSLADGQEIPSFDAIRVLDFVTSFMDIRFEALVNDMDAQRKDTVFAGPPLHIITVALRDGSHQVAKTYRKPGLPGEIDLEGNPVIYDRDRLYAVINEGQDMVLIQYFVFDRITRPLPYYK
jgi:hypothetical protein